MLNYIAHLEHVTRMALCVKTGSCLAPRFRLAETLGDVISVSFSRSVPNGQSWRSLTANWTALRCSWLVAQFNRAACACDLRSCMDPETVPGGTIRKNPAKPM